MNNQTDYGLQSTVWPVDMLPVTKIDNFFLKTWKADRSI